jgi:hypothetical protein
VGGLLRVILALALAGAVLWFGLPVAASGAAGALVSAAGLKGEDVSISVEARPPLKLLLLEADAMRVRSGSGTFRGATFKALDVTLSGVGLGRPLGSVAGRIEGVEFTDASGSAVSADSIDLSGPATAPDVRIEISAAEVATLVSRVLPTGIGLASAIALSAPDAVRITTTIGEFGARLVTASDGGLRLVLDGAGVGTVTLTVFAPSLTLPLRLHSAAVEGDTLVLRGKVDAAALGL